MVECTLRCPVRAFNTAAACHRLIGGVTEETADVNMDFRAGLILEVWLSRGERKATVASSSRVQQTVFKTQLSHSCRRVKALGWI